MPTQSTQRLPQRNSRHRMDDHMQKHIIILCCEDQCDLLKLVRITQYRPYWDFYILKRFLFTSGQIEVFKILLTASLALSLFLLYPSHCWSHSSPAHVFQWLSPLTESLEWANEKHFHKFLGWVWWSQEGILVLCIGWRRARCHF